MNHRISAFSHGPHRQAGMTLLELTVVLVVLVGLAGLVLPYAQGYIGRTHDSTGVSNGWEISNAIQRYDGLYNGLPANLDNLVTGDGTVVTPYLMNTAAVTGGATGLSVLNVQSLWRGGVTSLAGLCDGDANGTIGVADADADCATFNPTFDNYDSAADLTFAMNGNINGAAPATQSVATLTYGDAQAMCGFNIPQDADGDSIDDYVYALFGVGAGSDMIGRTMAEAPTHFAQIGAMNANNRYNRFVTLIRVDNDADQNGTGPEPARLACSGMAMSSIEGPDASMKRYYDRTENDG